MTTAEQTVAMRQAEEVARRAAVSNPAGPTGPDGKPLGVGQRTRPDERQVEMTYAAALALKAAGGGGRRQVLTERGWVRVAG